MAVPVFHFYIDGNGSRRYCIELADTHEEAERIAERLRRDPLTWVPADATGYGVEKP